jgi:succinate-semialdehyde dehydrogenase/glutarate-semialdehyde dehydrogenase
MEVINPATGEVVRTVEEHGDDEVESRLAAAETAFGAWRRTSFAERRRRMRRAAELLRERRAELARLMTEEMGKLVGDGEAEAEKCAWACDYFADNAEDQLAPQVVETGAEASFVRFDPLGPILAVMPWNFPFWQVFRFAAPALMAGNVGLLKHASNVPGCALAIEKIFGDAGFPAGVFTTLLVSSARTSELIGHPAIRAVTLTGSEAAGREVAARAGKNLKKTVLELGGSDPFIVLADADPREVARTAAKARTINSGQSCIAAKRFIVEEAVAGPFEEALVAAMEGLEVGDPMDRNTRVGPLAREDLLADLDAQVQRSVAQGATLATGGRRLDRPGFF